ncbi:small GTP-binding protein, putative [Trichomonas vaginalis G3]|uniref:Small GTP-binding protein, putative n=1 Tax=Trichomonas vaginalis (strain ATCC PRA-98 / G3) TaxID=412133 RepID=A2FDY9_TRIV3|nr:GTPase protein [Trichomonas vaginalis G3]EAX96868.1 small GTP-binding protein, putative [Trichomonas vaginalis G3]KAI5534786.1 GTPase protein [Trichomonas vaginalis G3]|eukprot:XP_001309798.1 small GTP-binding protein [Trichomonas vaginalis G3]
MVQVKIVLVGEAGVGKTCICERLISDSYSMQTAPTIGAANYSFTMKTDKQTLEFNIWDTAGQEKYRSLAPMYFAGAQVAILVFDLTQPHTLQGLDDFFELLRSRAPDCIHCLVGNKCDKPNERQVSDEEALAYAGKIGAIFYMETSAVTGQGIKDLFEQIANSNSIPIHEDELDFVQTDSTPAKKGCC